MVLRSVGANYMDALDKQVMAHHVHMAQPSQMSQSSESGVLGPLVKFVPQGILQNFLQVQPTNETNYRFDAHTAYPAVDRRVAHPIL